MTLGAIENNLSKLSISFLTGRQQPSKLGQHHYCQVLHPSWQEQLWGWHWGDYLSHLHSNVLFQTYSPCPWAGRAATSPGFLTLESSRLLTATDLLHPCHYLPHPCFCHLWLLPTAISSFAARNIENRAHLGRSSLERVSLMIISYLQLFLVIQSLISFNPLNMGDFNFALCYFVLYQNQTI